MWSDFNLNWTWKSTGATVQKCSTGELHLEFCKNVSDHTVRNTVSSPDSLVWKFSGNAQFPQSSGRTGRLGHFRVTDSEFNMKTVLYSQEHGILTCNCIELLVWTQYVPLPVCFIFSPYTKVVFMSSNIYDRGYLRK